MRDVGFKCDVFGENLVDHAFHAAVVRDPLCGVPVEFGLASDFVRFGFEFPLMAVVDFALFPDRIDLIVQRLASLQRQRPGRGFRARLHSRFVSLLLRYRQLDFAMLRFGDCPGIFRRQSHHAV